MPPVADTRVHFKRGKRRAAAKQPSPAECLRVLSACDLHGVLHRGAVWLRCARKLAYLLERVCLGRRARGSSGRGAPCFFRNVVGDERGGDSADDDPIVRLSPEEAFYVVWCLGSLTVHAPRDAADDAADGAENQIQNPERNAPPPPSLTPLTIDELWRALLTAGMSGVNAAIAAPRFVAAAASQIHFRSAGWLPRSGLQYGADLVLYRNHPSLVHSDCCVVVKPSSAIVSRASGVFGEGGELEKDSRWIEVQAASRLCVQVNKRLVFATLDVAGGDADFLDPECLKRLSVNEMEVTRFNPDRHLTRGERPP